MKPHCERVLTGTPVNVFIGCPHLARFVWTSPVSDTKVLFCSDHLEEQLDSFGPAKVDVVHPVPSMIE